MNLNLDFSMALRALKNGDRICRAGWNGKGQWVGMQRPDAGSLMTLPYAYLRTAHGELVPWLPSEGDLFAEDWQIVPRVGERTQPTNPQTSIVSMIRNAIEIYREVSSQRSFAHQQRSMSVEDAVLTSVSHVLRSKGIPVPENLAALIAAELNRQEG